jgi:hypothetical protein
VINVGYEAKIEKNMETINAVIVPGEEEILITFYGRYDIKGFGPGKNLRLNGTWCLTDKRMLFTGKAGFSSSWGGFAKAGKVMTIPYEAIKEIWMKKGAIKIRHTVKHEGRDTDKLRGISMFPHPLKVAPDTGKKEKKDAWRARTEMIFNKIKELAGIP